ncbi:MAG TPA: protein kinase [Kofleriaceae bacterium]|nr:protein kinase [Kofleriaceae bacterium]
MTERDLVGAVVVGRYRVAARVAMGSKGHVYEAEHIALGTHVALKVLAPEHADSEVAARFLREGKTLGMFRHRNIVELLEVGRLADGSLFLATELVRGVSLRSLIDGGPIEPRRALAITRQVLEALDHAHAMGVVHRDVRPENIMLTTHEGEELVKMLDFGVAKLFTDTAAVLGENKLTKVGITVLGDPRYTAPEVALGAAIDGRADLYSVGIVLKEMLGAQPLTPPVELVVSEATQKKQELRYRSAAEMISAIDTALVSLEPEPVPAEAPPQFSAPGSVPAFESPGLFSAPTEAPPFSVPQTPLHMSSSTPLQAPQAVRPLPAPPASVRSVPGRGRVDRLLAFVRARRMIVAGVGGAVLLVIVLAVLFGGSKKSSSDLAARAKQMIAAGNAKEAVDLLETELATKPDASAFLQLGHARFAVGRRTDALTAYERAIVLDRSLGKDPDLRANAAFVLDGKDAIAAVLALELLASRVDPPAKDLIATTAASGKLLEVRRRALALAERDGFADRVDRVAVFTLDLAQATTCDERRAVIGKLRATADKRAVAPLKRAKVYKCVEKEATDAIAELETKP